MKWKLQTHEMKQIKDHKTRLIEYGVWYYNFDLRFYAINCSGNLEGKEVCVIVRDDLLKN